MLNQKLSQKMLQKLSPQQIQLMKLLQIPTATLDQRIKEELEANPALDENEDEIRETKEDEPFGDEKENKEDSEAEEDFQEKEDFELDDYLLEYIEEDPNSYKYHDTFVIDDEDKSLPISTSNSFHEYLEAQLGMLKIKDERRMEIAHQIIGSIDDDGYLRREPESIVDDLLFGQNIEATEEEIYEILTKVQKFDPPGIGAWDLQECLLIQVNILIEQLKKEDKEDINLMVAYKILKNHFNEFSKKHFHKLLKHLDINDKQLKDAIDSILKLNPKPASGYQDNSRSNSYYILPDFTIVNRDGELDLSLNSRNAPDLKINDQYKGMLTNYKETTQGRRANRKEKEAIQFIKQKIDSAKWFIDAIRQRQHTMYKTMYAIMQYQYNYFLTGDDRKLKPMILKDIADITALDISTISRVANSKFVQTEFGTKRLKDFFSESILTQDGTEVSTLEVKNILSDIIQEENKNRPFSDEKLKNLLLEKGYNIARRTVAKYREQLNIPVARLRKEL